MNSRHRLHISHLHLGRRHQLMPNSCIPTTAALSDLIISSQRTVSRLASNARKSLSFSFFQLDSRASTASLSSCFARSSASAADVLVRNALSASDGLSMVAVKRLDKLDSDKTRMQESTEWRNRRMSLSYSVCLHSSDRNSSAKNITGKLREGISSSGRADIFSIEGWPVLQKT